MAKEQVEKTIKYYDQLLQEYPSSESWANNIFKACKLLSTGAAQTNFYRYLFDPANYVFQENVKLISEEEEEKYNRLVEEFDKANPHTVKIYKNGRDGNIVYLPSKQNASQKIEPLDSILGTIPQETQNSFDESRDARCCESVQKEIDEKIDD